MTQPFTQELVYEFILSDPEGLLVETWVRGGRQVYRYTTGGVMFVTTLMVTTDEVDELPFASVATAFKA